MRPLSYSRSGEQRVVPFVEGVGRFPIGHWHHNEDAPDFVWKLAKADTPLGPLPWRLEAFEGAILCFMNEIREERYLQTAAQDEPIALPVVAVWASFSLLMNRFAFGPLVDVKHAFSWHRPLRIGEATILSGRIIETFEKRGRHYLVWSTVCKTPEGDPIFDLTHTIIDLRGADGLASAG